ncbi:hypothetical protein JMJ77_0007577 [Colletotrichum scovillei]|uniref:Uncharacterized protein n=1 Tax=Colletotrichum scovillei TaxID=1209932 RepID=A0A9P7RFB1_9PEZI|nr:hypothetical protein JMJ77_0007577 [Colletotrichum scovillei]KAG7074554.1 hypothetical protein JMJ76_0011031 [Colletotrichum scovillei]KAG7081520.1 hypothetical protein JMJ78_0003639 [Colletotrichum scovillei]
MEMNVLVCESADRRPQSLNDSVNMTVSSSQGLYSVQRAMSLQGKDWRGKAELRRNWTDGVRCEAPQTRRNDGARQPERDPPLVVKAASRV